MNDVFTALQSTLGGIFVNNFNLYGRTWQVNIEGEAADRRDFDDIWQIYVRNKTGEMVPMRSIADRALRRRPAGHHALQQLPLDHDQRQPRAGRLVGRRAGRDGGGLGQDPAAGLRLRMDRHRLPGA